MSYFCITKYTIKSILFLEVKNKKKFVICLRAGAVEVCTVMKTAKKKKKSPLDWPNSVEIIPVNIFFSASFPLDVKCVFLY